MIAPREASKGAYDLVHSLHVATRTSPQLRERALTLCRRLPAMLQRNGLGQTMAFLYAKGGGPRAVGPEGALLKALLRLVLPEAGDDAMRALTDLDAARYARAGRDALDVAIWVKRVAEGMLKEDGP